MIPWHGYMVCHGVSKSTTIPIPAKPIPVTIPKGTLSNSAHNLKYKINDYIRIFSKSLLYLRLLSGHVIQSLFTVGILKRFTKILSTDWWSNRKFPFGLRNYYCEHAPLYIKYIKHCVCWGQPWTMDGYSVAHVLGMTWVLGMNGVYGLKPSLITYFFVPSSLCTYYECV